MKRRYESSNTIGDSHKALMGKSAIFNALKRPVESGSFGSIWQQSATLSHSTIRNARR